MKEHRIVEPRFTSDAPLVGPAIVAARRAWNWMSTKWYVRPIIDQQNVINANLAAEIDKNELTGRVALASAVEAEKGVHLTRTDLALVSARLAEADRQITELRAEIVRLSDADERPRPAERSVRADGEEGE